MIPVVVFLPESTHGWDAAMVCFNVMMGTAMDPTQFLRGMQSKLANQENVWQNS